MPIQDVCEDVFEIEQGMFRMEWFYEKIKE